MKNTCVWFYADISRSSHSEWFWKKDNWGRDLLGGTEGADEIIVFNFSFDQQILIDWQISIFLINAHAQIEKSIAKIKLIA